MKSWKTTTAGIAGIVSVIAAALQAQFDADPNTIPNWTSVISVVITGAGLLFARDNNVTSEQAGAK